MDDENTVVDTEDKETVAEEVAEEEAEETEEAEEVTTSSEGASI